MQTLSPEERQLAEHLIEKYRKSVEQRYDYDALAARLDLPPQLNREVAAKVKRYFLENIYPPAEKRAQLDKAFDHLDTYLTHPSKIWHLLGNMTAAVFKFGRHFPAALKGGFISLESFRDAKQFETTMLQAARKKDFDIPLTDAQFKECLVSIPRDEVERFLKDISAFFKSLNDTVLLRKTIEILKGVIKKMKKYPRLYSSDEIEGVAMGVEILENGYLLFKDFSPALKKGVLRTIKANELWFLGHLHETDEP